MANKDDLRIAFIDKAQKKFGDQFDYSKVEYSGVEIQLPLSVPNMGNSKPRRLISFKANLDAKNAHMKNVKCRPN